MHVPVFVMRQVLVNVSPAPMMLLSVMVTSLTNDALLVQPGSFSGRGADGVDVMSGVVAVGSTVSVAPVMGISMVGAWVATAV
jgi:hypothetical protein